MIEITPTPDESEAAAIAAALGTVLMGGGSVATPQAPSRRWRFSGRWWARGPITGRRRP